MKTELSFPCRPTSRARPVAEHVESGTDGVRTAACVGRRRRGRRALRRVRRLDPRGRADRAGNHGTTSCAWAWQPVVKVWHPGIFGIDMTAHLFYTGGHGDGYDT